MNAEKIDYEMEVKRVYPDSEYTICDDIDAFDEHYIGSYSSSINLATMIYSNTSEWEVWKLAYETLKTQGKYYEQGKKVE